MLPKNNKNIYPDNANAQQSSNNGNQHFRPTVSVSGIPFSLNSNLVVTQQQQPSRNNNAFQINTQNNSLNQIEVAKRFAAVIQQTQTSSHLINRPSQSPIHIASNQNPQISLDRAAVVRLPQNPQTDTANLNNIYQALYLIQQNMHQMDKSKPILNHSVEVCRPSVSTINNPLALSNSTSNNLQTIAINSTSHSQNATVLAMSKSDMQLLEAIGRYSSQQVSKPSTHPNVSLIQSDSLVAKPLLNALQKQSPRTSTGFSSPSFMVIGPTSKLNNPSQVNQNKDNLSISTAQSHSNGQEGSNHVLLKPDIPWTKLLDNLSNNSENIMDVNRSYKVRVTDGNQRSTSTKILSTPRLLPDNTKYDSNESIYRNCELNSGTNSLKSVIKPPNKTDIHQILLESKKASYMMSGSNSVSINNEDMVNLHFQQSLSNKLDIKKPLTHNNTFIYKSFNPVSTNADHHGIKNNGNTKKRPCYSFIDLERPEYGNKNSVDNCQRVSTHNQNPSCTSSSNSKITIKETTDAMVEDLLRRSLDGNSSLIKQNVPAPFVTNSTHGRPTNDVSSNSIINGNSSMCPSSVNHNTDLVSIQPRHSHPNSIPLRQDSSYKVLQFSNGRPNPLPLKKRIMRDFNEKDDENIPNQHFVNAVTEFKSEMTAKNDEKPMKIRRKRIHSISGDNKSDSILRDPNLSTTKKRPGRIPGTGKKQKLKEEYRLKELEKISLAGTEETWQELMKTIVKPPDIESITAKTLSPLNLDSLKLSKEEFFQIGSCSEIAPRMVKCRSCRQNNASNNANNQESLTNNLDDCSSMKSGSKDSSNISAVSSFCRFHGFRKLQFSAKGTLTQAGFCKSNEADSQDLSLWRMYQPLPSELSVSIATYLVGSLSSIFCEIMESENKFLQKCWESSEDFDNKKINGSNYSTNTNKTEFNMFVWKRPVSRVREMCDVCETSIFNTHLACRKCGYSICVDCFNERQDKPFSGNIRSSIQQDSKERESDNLLNKISNLNKNAVHQNTRGATKNRYFSCDHPWAVCTANRQQHNPDQMLKVELIPIRVINELRNRMHTVAKLLHIKLKCNCLSKSKNDSEIKLTKQFSLESIPAIETDDMGSGSYDLHMLADIALKEVVNTEQKCSSYDRPNPTTALRPPPVLSPPHHPENSNYINCNLQDIKSLEPNDSYSWINVASNFKIIHLHNAQSEDNLKLFQQQWLLAHPVLVSGCHKTMDLSLWTPEKFLEEFESEPAVLVDCETGFPVPKATMKSFWEGFSCVSKRISSTECSSKPACLKLKDWPPSDDFGDVLPQRCKDILSNLPLKEYTGRQGEFNLAAHLPDFFVCPDLGPKLYNAYGMPRESKLGTTNLHLDIADAVNVMLYVGISHDQIETETQNTLDSMREAKVDESVLKRADNELPGALWHIFRPKDVPKLRQFLIEVILERGESVEPNHDPIHDQQFYLNQTLLDRLKEEKNVEGCAIVQFRGDAVFIPAGSPHQVRNLHSCMKVANDFVSPENILHCLLVTKEFRKLSATHANHEDKLQAKNMIFHAVKDAVSTLIQKNDQFLTDINVKQREHQMKRKLISHLKDSEPLPSSVDTPLKKIKEESGTPRFI